MGNKRHKPKAGGKSKGRTLKGVWRNELDKKNGNGECRKWEEGQPLGTAGRLDINEADGPEDRVPSGREQSFGGEGEDVGK